MQADEALGYGPTACSTTESGLRRCNFDGVLRALGDVPAILRQSRISVLPAIPDQKLSASLNCNTASTARGYRSYDHDAQTSDWPGFIALQYTPNSRMSKALFQSVPNPQIVLNEYQISLASPMINHVNTNHHILKAFHLFCKILLRPFSCCV